MFSRHFPFDKAIEPLLKTFDIEPSIGQLIDFDCEKRRTNFFKK